ncbi:MAG: iron ABC transporter permease [Bryobacteraceae bacterium]
MGERNASGRVRRAVLWSGGICVLVLLLSPLAGASRLDLAKVLAGEAPDRDILLYLRLPRTLLAMLAGGCLCLAGSLFQALLRDALATPYTLGISSGAALGAVAAICFGWRQAGPLPAVWLAAIAGAAVVLWLVLLISSEGHRLSSFTLLLTGVTINSICLALILFLHSFAGFAQSFAISRWLMGGVDSIDYASLAMLAAVVTPPAALILFRSREWNLLAMGEEWATARGLSTDQLMRMGYVAASIVIGAVTALTGPIGFVGLIVPHVLRSRLGSDHRILMPCSILLGAAFLAVCDTIARTLLAPVDVPVGVVTALFGGPFFIWLLRSKRRSLWL